MTLGGSPAKVAALWPQERYLAKQQYYIQIPSTVGDGALENYGPNFGYDYGGRLMAA